MGVNVTEERERQKATVTSDDGQDRQGTEPAGDTGRSRLFARVSDELRSGLRELEWQQVLLYGMLAGILMPLSLAQAGILSFFAGIIPVGAGLILGRRVKGHYALHGLVAGLLGALVALIGLAGLLYLTPLGEAARQTAIAQGTPPESASANALLIQFGSFIAFSLITFCTFGASMAGRSEERNRTMRAEVEERGGRLERPQTIRTADDIRGLSLPQFGGYVNNLFKKNGFELKDYRFIDKDKHLDLWMQHEGEPWHLRLTVQDKVSPGTIESLAQDMRREGSRKGVVVTSTEFTPSATKSAKGRPIVLIDGQMLFQIAEA